MAWFVFTDGAPPEPSYDELLSGKDQPQPHMLLKRLFRELAGITLKKSKEVVREKESYVETAHGYCGDQNVGYLWESSIPVDDTSLPIDETYLTYGLPGAILIWSVAYRKRGQLGYATWTSVALTVRLDGPAPDTFERVWTEVFGVGPVFDPVPPQDEQKYEDFARQREEQLRSALRSTGRPPA
jgi:hypothetical protein